MFSQWVSSYFDHDDLSTRDLDAISYFLPSTTRTPTIFNMSPTDIREIVDERISATVEDPVMFLCMAQAHENYLKACFDPSTRARLPKMKVWNLTGDKTVSFPIVSYFLMQEDNTSRGGRYVNFKLIHGVNHLVRRFQRTSGRVIFLNIMYPLDAMGLSGTRPQTVR